MYIKQINGQTAMDRSSEEIVRKSQSDVMQGLVVMNSLNRLAKLDLLNTYYQGF